MKKRVMKKTRFLILSAFCLMIAKPVIASPSYIIFDNTAGLNSAAIMSNMNTSLAANCSKDNVLTDNTCNSFNLNGNDIQVVQNDGRGNIVSMIGVNNTNSTSYGNTNTENKTFHFTPGQEIFDIDVFRNAAAKISLLRTNLPASNYPFPTSGNISFQDFLMNIATGKTMNGIVRVKVPVGEDTASLLSDNRKFKMCGNPGAAPCQLCAPNTDTILKPGVTLCGITLPQNSKINVNGALMFDWINSATGDVVRADEFPINPAEINLSLALPLNINPANIDATTQTMKSTNYIQTITGSNICTNGSPCNVPITSAIDFTKVPDESKNMFSFKINKTLDATLFSSLSKNDQYHLLFPSGYAKGWSNAFAALGISTDTWENWVFNKTANTNTVPALDNTTISQDYIRSESFGDIPALIYTGGLIRIKHHTNISGLVYAAQAIEISQNDIGDSSKQYINGAVLTRNGFYFEATNGGITLIGNNPDSYSKTKLAPNNKVGKFQLYTNKTPNLDDPSLLGQKIVSNAKTAAANGPQWVEIRPK